MRAFMLALALAMATSPALAARQTLHSKVTFIRWLKAYGSNRGILEFALQSMGNCERAILVNESDSAQVLSLLLQAKSLDLKVRVTTDDVCRDGACHCKVSAIEFL